MNRNGSPNISAIEDRALAQAERVARLRREAMAEASEASHRRSVASSFGQSAEVLSRSHGSNFAAEAERVAKRKAKSDDIEDRIVSREPCSRCGTRRDMHDRFGCKRWRQG